jgi:microcystin-dependent protein
MRRTLKTSNLLLAETGVIQSSIPIGMVIPYAGVQVPPRWLICNGSNVSRSTYSKLFSIIGTLYGTGDNVTTFNLPDFRGRFILGLDPRQHQSPGLNHGGSAQNSLTVNELPAHQHDKRTLQILASGTHTHTYIDPGHNHGGQTGESPTRFNKFDWGYGTYQWSS